MFIMIEIIIPGWFLSKFVNDCILPMSPFLIFHNEIFWSILVIAIIFPSADETIVFPEGMFLLRLLRKIILVK